MFTEADTFARTNWQDPDGRAQARAIDWIWEQRELKEPYERRAAMNYAFYEGRQLHEWNDLLRQMVLPGRYAQMSESEHCDALIFNVSKYLLNQKLAKFSRSEPIWNVPSYTSDEYDQTVARFSNELMAWQALHNLRIPRVNDQLLRHAFCSPVTFVEPYWDATKGDPIQTTLDDYYRPAQQAPDNAAADMIAQYESQNTAQRTEDLTSYRRMRGYQSDSLPITQYSGDVAIQIRTIFDAMWYPFMVTDWDQVQAFLVSTVMTPEQIRSRYRLPYEEIFRHRNSSDVSERHEKIRGAYSSPYIQQPYAGDEYDNGIIVHQLHVKRNADLPNGATCVKLGHSNRCIEPGQLGNASNTLPLYPFSEYPGVTHAVGSCSMDDIISAQIEINDAKQKGRELRRQRVNAKVIRKKNDGSHPDALKDDSYDYEVDDMADAPKVLSLPIEGIEEAQAVQFALRFMQDAVGIPDISLGRTDDSDVKSGKAVLALTAGANERLTTTGKELNALWSRVGSHILTDLQHYAVEARITGIVGDDKRLVYRQWSAADLQPSSYSQFPDQTANVVVNTFSDIQQSPQEQQALLIKLLELNAFPDVRVRNQMIARVVGMNDVKTLFDPDETARDRANDNIRRWQNGQQVPPPMHHQKHREFISVYEKFVDSDDFFTLMQRNPQGARELQEHIEQHKQLEVYAEAMDAVRRQLAIAQASRDGADRALALGMQGAAIGLFQQSQMLGGSMGAPNRDGDSKAKDRGESKSQRPARRAGDAEREPQRNGPGGVAQPAPPMAA